MMSDNGANESITEFVRNYKPDQRDAIRFVWNGKHAADFKDENQEFRSSLATLILSEPNAGSVILIRDLLLEDALWSREAWCAPNHFAGLLSILLERGGREYLTDFTIAMNATFDTFGAAHGIVLSHELTRELLQETDRRLLIEKDKPRRVQLESTRKLFGKLIEGNAAEGWATVPPGTPVRNIRIVPTSLPPRLGGRKRMWTTFKGWLMRRLPGRVE